MEFVLLVTLSLLASFLSTTALAKEPVGIPNMIPFADTTHVPEAVRRECKLPEKTASSIKKYGKGDVAFVETA